MAFHRLLTVYCITVRHHFVISVVPYTSSIREAKERESTKLHQFSLKANISTFIEKNLKYKNETKQNKNNNIKSCLLFYHLLFWLQISKRDKIMHDCGFSACLCHLYKYISKFDPVSFFYFHAWYWYMFICINNCLLIEFKFWKDWTI